MHYDIVNGEPRARPANVGELIEYLTGLNDPNCLVAIRRDEYDDDPVGLHIGFDARLRENWHLRAPTGRNIPPEGTYPKVLVL